MLLVRVLRPCNCVTECGAEYGVSGCVLFDCLVRGCVCCARDSLLFISNGHCFACTFDSMRFMMFFCIGGCMQPVMGPAAGCAASWLSIYACLAGRRAPGPVTSPGLSGFACLLSWALLVAKYECV